MRAARALAALLRDSEEWREFFRQCCESGPLRLRTQAGRQFRDELQDRGHVFDPVEDAMLAAARRLLPNTPRKVCTYSIRAFYGRLLAIRRKGLGGSGRTTSEKHKSRLARNREKGRGDSPGPLGG